MVCHLGKMGLCVGGWDGVGLMRDIIIQAFGGAPWYQIGKPQFYLTRY